MPLLWREKSTRLRYPVDVAGSSVHSHDWFYDSIIADCYRFRARWWAAAGGMSFALFRTEDTIGVLPSVRLFYFAKRSSKGEKDRELL